MRRLATDDGEALTRAGKRRLAVHHPVLGLQRCPEAIERLILVGFVGAPHVHFALAVGAGNGVEVLAAEDLRQRGGGEQESAARRREPASFVGAQCAVGDDAVDMHVLSQVLPPDMQHHGDTEFAAQPPGVASELQQGPRGGVEQQPVDQPRVEILSLRWDEVDLERGDAWVIPGRIQGEPMKTINWPWKKLRKATGLEDVRLHDLRHAFASRALALGESLPVIGKLLGHTQVQTTARYAHLAEDSVKESAARIAASIGEDIPGVARGANNA